MGDISVARTAYHSEAPEFRQQRQQTHNIKWILHFCSHIQENFPVYEQCAKICLESLCVPWVVERKLYNMPVCTDSVSEFLHYETANLTLLVIAYTNFVIIW